MATQGLAAIILAAGMGTRMRSDMPKVLHELAGRPMINYLLDTISYLEPERVVVVVGPGMEAVTKAVAPHPTVVQEERLGTGHAVAQARALLGDFQGDVLVLFGDTPLVSRQTLSRMIAARRGGSQPTIVVLGFQPEEGGEYGRLLLGPGGAGVAAIIEHRDATPDQRALPLCNSGVMCIDGTRLWGLIDQLGNDNAKGEYYLTDIVALAGADEFQDADVYCDFVEGSASELLGINSRAELARAETVVQNRLRARALESGATLVDPASVYFHWDTKIGRDVVIHPQVIFGPGVSVGDRVLIKGFCHIDGATIAEGAEIGPFARLRPGAEIGPDVHIGNFVEVKKSTIERGAKVNHLTYIGDARVGEGANVGAGTITCNYDGFTKSVTDIGANAFIGSNTSLVAPVRVGDGAVIGAGSVITTDVAEGSLALARATQIGMPGWAERFREKKRAEKAAAKADNDKVK
jgi:bifunctional UDP-N-acetylglucosamine pyrophosphorylase/glucosamine-1-phosphate N-acetyltransferase